MFSNAYKEWATHISEIDEFFGKEPRYPITTMQQHLKLEFREQNQIINNSTDKIATNIQTATTSICSTLENGFENLITTNENGFNRISESVDYLSAISDWGFTQLIEQQKASNVLLSNIALLLKIPDIQKERQYYLEQGLKFFTNSKADKSFYDDALENFNKAENIEKTDYYLLQKIGLVYMFSINHLDINKALDYFLKSAKYSLGETHSFSQQTLNYLENEIDKEFSIQLRSIFDVKKLTINSYLLASRCYYILKDYSNSLLFANKALELDYNRLDSLYDKAKYLCKMNRVNESIPIIESIIKQDRFISLKILNDFDIASKNEILDLLNNLKNDEIQNAQRELNKFNVDKVQNPRVLEIIKNAREYFNKKTFLDAKTAIDFLTKKSEWNFSYVNDQKMNIKQVLSNLKNRAHSLNHKNVTQQHYPVLSTKKEIGTFYEYYINTIEIENSKNEIEEIKNILNALFEKKKRVNNNFESAGKLAKFVFEGFRGAGIGAFIGIITGLIGLFFGVSFWTVYIATVIISAIGFGYLMAYVIDE